MEKDEKFSLMHSIVRCVLVLPLISSVITRFIDLLEEETQLAGKKIVLLLILLMLFAAFIASAWLCLLGMIFVYLIMLKLSWIASLSIIFILNLLLLAIVGLIILNIKKDLLFPKLRQLLLRFRE